MQAIIPLSGRVQYRNASIKTGRVKARDRHKGKAPDAQKYSHISEGQPHREGVREQVLFGGACP